MQTNPRSYLFTLSAGRTGTAWLADFLAANLAVEAIHEPLDIADFGVRMPDIKLMRTFNDLGSTELVRSFWRHKFTEISHLKSYIETNHTLAKCGLIENLAVSDINHKSCIIILKRRLQDQCKSYISRHDFSNITLQWQWYLTHHYNNNILPFELFENLGFIGHPIWYAFEMEARQVFYQKIYSKELKFIEENIDDLNKTENASQFLSAFGIKGDPIFPPRANEQSHPVSPEMSAYVETVFSNLSINIEEIVARFIDSGKTLDQSPHSGI
jgi:hypothetical protein